MGGHEQHLRPTKYRTIHDIPDSMVKTYSERDPENMIYKTRRWVDFKKKQILFCQQDGVPMYLRTARSRFIYYSIWAGAFGSFFYNIYVYKKYNKK